MFEKYERKVCSQNGEDGVLERIFEILKIKMGFSVEINTSGDIIDTKYLLTVKKWLGTSVSQYKGVPYRMTPKNIGRILQGDNKFSDISNSINLLIIDVDGLDFYILDGVLNGGFTPQVIMIEYNASLGFADSVMPYDENHVWDGTNYFGASITALNRLGQENGYVLIYADSTGSNLFLVRRDLVKEFKGVESSVEKIYRPPAYGINGHPPDKLHREYWPYERASKIVDKITRVAELKG